MLIYVTHAYRGKHSDYEKIRKIIHNLQKNDLENTYICPLLVLSHMGYKELTFEQEKELRLDMITVCDKLLVVGDFSPMVEQELDFADLIDMEVDYYEQV